MNKEAANYTKPKKTITIHYGSLIRDISLKDSLANMIKETIEVDIYIK